MSPLGRYIFHKKHNHPRHRHCKSCWEFSMSLLAKENVEALALMLVITVVGVQNFYHGFLKKSLIWLPHTCTLETMCLVPFIPIQLCGHDLHGDLFKDQNSCQNRQATHPFAVFLLRVLSCTTASVCHFYSQYDQMTQMKPNIVQRAGYRSSFGNHQQNLNSQCLVMLSNSLKVWEAEGGYAVVYTGCAPVLQGIPIKMKVFMKRMQKMQTIKMMNNNLYTTYTPNTCRNASANIGHKMCKILCVIKKSCILCIFNPPNKCICIKLLSGLKLHFSAVKTTFHPSIS